MTFSFSQLNPVLQQALQTLNYSQPTPIQRQAIPVVLSGNDVMAGAQTGTGKTAAFALPILDALLQQTPSSDSASQELPQAHVQALILVPTRELAQQVHQSFEQYAQYSSLKVGLAYGGVSLNPQLEALKQGVDVLVATPGRLLDFLFKKAVSLDALNTLVFDEADRMLDMGFMDEIQQILKRLPKERQTLLFSATFSDEIFKLSKQLLNDPQLIEVDARNTAATTVEQKVYVVDADRKRELVSHLIGSKNWHQVLIFVKTKQGADALAAEMCKDGLVTKAIHGDKSQGARECVLEEFRSGDTRVLVATDVAARGIDIPALNTVINFDLPYIAEDYIHRIGRTGRAGQTGTAITLMSLGEEYLLEEIEVILDERLPQQWLEGYEPDLTKEIPENRKNTRTAQKRRAKQRAHGQSTGKRRRRK
ncbi:DEAD/DEAH box helicase [Bacterioplanoides sp.]|uniref:DEAD/DEAH box helicase n=1 Tax=Bacterioplanoides sp. TaxID=2066072 RepID=UPI003B007170